MVPPQPEDQKIKKYLDYLNDPLNLEISTADICIAKQTSKGKLPAFRKKGVFLVS